MHLPGLRAAGFDCFHQVLEEVGHRVRIREVAGGKIAVTSTVLGERQSGSTTDACEAERLAYSWRYSCRSLVYRTPSTTEAYLVAAYRPVVTLGSYSTL